MIFLVLLLFVETTQGLSVSLTGDWIVNVGGYVNCSWAFQDYDSLQSVKIYYGNQELAVFRPEIHRTELSTIAKNDAQIFSIDCTNRQRMPKIGHCIVKTSLYPQPPPPDSYWFACEVSGERPYFRLVRKTLLFRPFVAASDAVLETSEDLSRGRAKLNCTSSGLPEPNVQWNVANIMTTPDFSDSTWNSSTKLWDVWSSISLTHAADKALEVVCTPSQEGLQNARDISASYTLKMLNSADRLRGIFSVLSLILLLIHMLS